MSGNNERISISELPKCPKCRKIPTVYYTMGIERNPYVTLYNPARGRGLIMIHGDPLFFENCSMERMDYVYCGVCSTFFKKTEFPQFYDAMYNYMIFVKKKYWDVKDERQ